MFTGRLKNALNACPSDRKMSRRELDSFFKMLFFSIVGGAVLMLLPIALEYLDPVQRYAKYNLRLDNNTLIHELLLRPFEGLKLYIRVFNVTNAEEFLNGTDEKVKMEEVGPFVYQEIRTNEDIVINQQPGIMWYTPKLRAVFVPEESVGDPKDIYLTVPNIPLLSLTALLSKYPYFVQQVYNMIVSNSQSKVFKKIRLYDLLWGYDDPLIALANKVVPGLVYFKSFGLLNRLYDSEYDYRLEIGTKNSEKFAVKKSIRIKPKNKPDSKVYVEKTLILPNNTYEGEVFPLDLPPDQHIHIYRPSTCRTFQFQHIGYRPMFYGGDALVYKLHDSTLNDHQMCDTKGWCPDGLMSLAPCYMDMPLVVSKGHFLDADPRLLDLVDGLKPDRKLHDAELVIDPKVGVTVTAALSMQVSLFLPDMASSPETSRLQDTVLPIIVLTTKSPPLIEEALVALRFVYKDGPRMLLTVQICCALLGSALLVYSARQLCCNRLFRNNALNFNIKNFSKAHQPLMIEDGPPNLTVQLAKLKN